MNEISKPALRTVSLFILGLALVPMAREAGAQAPKPEEVHVFYHAKAADFPTVHKLPTDKRHLLLPGTAPASLAIGKDLKVVLFRYPHFVSGPKGYRGEPQWLKDQNKLCEYLKGEGLRLIGPYFPSWESSAPFHLVLNAGTHTDLASEDYFIDGSDYRFASMIIFRADQNLPAGVLLRNFREDEALVYEVFLPLPERYFEISAVYQDPRLSVFGRGVSLQGWPIGSSLQVTLHPNPQPGTSKPILMPLEADHEYAVDLEDKGFHGLWKVEIMNPNIAVLAEGAITSFFDRVTPRRVELDLSGRWDSDLGEARFEQEGDRVQGLLIYREPAGPRRSATLEGTMREGRLEFTWYFTEDERGRRNPQGRGVLEPAERGRALSGWYTDRDVDGGKTRQRWSLRR